MNIKDEEVKRRQASMEKAARFKKYSLDYMNKRESVPTGHKNAGEIAENREHIKKLLGADDEDWSNWKWHIKNRISDAETVSKIIELTDEEMDNLSTIGKKFRWAVAPHFMSLISRTDKECPIRRQVIPVKDELLMTGIPDFSGEEYSSPVESLVRWYPDRVIIKSTNICGSFCRHCLRRRHIGEVDQHTGQEQLNEALRYIRENPDIRDVLITGGDPLLFSVEKLDWLLGQLDEIEHVEIKRIGTRIAFIPMRVDKELCDMLSTHHPLFMNFQFNHPKEITAEVARATDMLSRAGIPMGNQTVLLRGVNDDGTTMKVLNHELLKIRVKPYYIYHCQGTIGIAHLRTTVEKGIEILEELRGTTSGLAVPDYIITPTGLGKTPLAPSYWISSGDGYVTLRNWEGTVYRYDNPQVC